MDEGLLKREVSVDDRALVWEFTVIDKPDVNAFVLRAARSAPAASLCRPAPMPAPAPVPAGSAPNRARGRPPGQTS